MNKIVIDCNDSILGRVSSFAAKKALEGNEIILINSENILISGNKKNIMAKYSSLRRKGGHSQKGPKISRLPHMVLKRTIRSMLPDHRWGQGKASLQRIKCYQGFPEEFKNEKILNIANDKKIKSIKLGEMLKII